MARRCLLFLILRVGTAMLLHATILASTRPIRAFVPKCGYSPDSRRRKLEGICRGTIFAHREGLASDPFSRSLTGPDCLQCASESEIGFYSASVSSILPWA